ncbi:hypothetical protein EVAR_3414_1 [Eumeta japonica]|uniref:Uncharacterized protein n=1 Tax=Eumeta variegata TaxID=151549 RepID=A0A4C1SSI1_EUMVA|nr:hypothetical protein EVAR_3414_1 [Eumeta japonica]
MASPDPAAVLRRCPRDVLDGARRADLPGGRRRGSTYTDPKLARPLKAALLFCQIIALLRRCCITFRSFVSTQNLPLLANRATYKLR